MESLRCNNNNRSLSISCSESSSSSIFQIESTSYKSFGYKSNNKNIAIKHIHAKGKEDVNGFLNE
eukprot:Pgem_evm1s17191